MSMLNERCVLSVGTRDAIHVPIVAAKADHSVGYDDIKPGCFIKFLDKEYSKFVLCDKKEAHGMVNPFIEQISSYDTVIVFIMPDITSPVRHQFEINPTQRDWQQKILEQELEEAKVSDPDCAGCYAIENGQVIRY